MWININILLSIINRFPCQIHLELLILKKTRMNTNLLIKINLQTVLIEPDNLFITTRCFDTKEQTNGENHIVECKLKTFIYEILFFCDGNELIEGLVKCDG